MNDFIRTLSGLNTTLDVIRKGEPGFDIGLFHEFLGSFDVLTTKRVFDAGDIPAGSWRQRLVIRSPGDAVIGDLDYRFPVDGVKERFSEVLSLNGSWVVLNWSILIKPPGPVLEVTRDSSSITS